MSNSKVIFKSHNSDFVIDVEAQTLQNSYYRNVLYTSPHMQFVLMSIPPGQEIGKEVHQGDQFIRVESGQGILEINKRRYKLKDGVGFIVPSGEEHNVINPTSAEVLQIYTIYSPPQHKANKVEYNKEY